MMSILSRFQALSMITLAIRLTSESKIDLLYLNIKDRLIIIYRIERRKRESFQVIESSNTRLL